VVDSPGWGFVNHSSNVVMEDNVAYDVIGASFTTEAGDEIGAFRRNLAVKSTGSGAGIESRGRAGLRPSGRRVLVQAPGRGQRQYRGRPETLGFVYFTQGLKRRGSGRASSSPPTSRTFHRRRPEHIAVADVPIRLFFQ
jgi:hypothetical protein